MIRGFTLILLFWILGESLHFLSGIPISGNVLGMLLLFGWLMIRQQVSPELERSSQLLIAQLSLLLLPGGVGLFFLGDRMQGQWLPVLAAIVIGTLLSMLFCVWLMKRLSHKVDTPKEAG
ncbi:CidA/LrgA family protein [Motiliproteus coralliicola]|uniref:CidA/LrgA family protein n=1 Tax=Motiliproteus coralliicola TaxID=2283196 RepID=A0A369WQW8_9GAMM|nr:CidA/LrgA family protein [Motiliproteus coralliicola]RDE22956.1 CidA/LrgA family protein [Motiliproteus coralliicola]